MDNEFREYERLKKAGKIKPNREDPNNIQDYWEKWKLTPIWQAHILDLFRQNDEHNIIPFLGNESPKKHTSISYQRDISLALLTLLYIEVPYQMGLYKIIKHFHRLDKNKVSYQSGDDAISSQLKEENFFFIKMESSTGFRNFIVKYLALISYILKIDFPSEYKRNQWVYALMQVIFPKESSKFGKTSIKIEDIKASLHHIEKRYTSAVWRMINGISTLYGTIFMEIQDDFKYLPTFTAENIPIYAYLDEFDRLDYCLYLILDFHITLSWSPEVLTDENGGIFWKEYNPEPKTRRYLT